MKHKNKFLLIILTLVVFLAGYEIGIYASFKHGPGHILSTEKQICPADKDCYFEPSETREIIYGKWLIWLDNENPNKYILISDLNKNINYRITRAFNEKGLSNLSVATNDETFLDMRDINESGHYDLINYTYKKENNIFVTSKDVGMDGSIDGKYLRNTAENSLYDILNKKYIYRKKFNK